MSDPIGQKVTVYVLSTTAQLKLPEPLASGHAFCNDTELPALHPTTRPDTFTCWSGGHAPSRSSTAHVAGAQRPPPVVPIGEADAVGVRSASVLPERELGDRRRRRRLAALVLEIAGAAVAGGAREIAAGIGGAIGAAPDAARPPVRQRYAESVLVSLELDRGEA
nr:unnamed protein product [Digitaria exilis]